MQNHIPTRLKTLAAALALGASLSCVASEAPYPMQAWTAPSMSESGITRAEVRAELDAARANGTLCGGSEIGDTPDILAARDAANLAQADAIEAEQRAQQERALAQAMATLTSAHDDVHIDIIVLDAGSATRQSDRLVVVSLDADDSGPALDRIAAIRRELLATGLQRGQIYLEAGRI
jgi:Domain of unknown function (DUF4148)